MEEKMIRMNGISKRYGKQVIFEGFDLELPVHQIISILGPSGCGKTTLLNGLAGLTRFDQGSFSGFSTDDLSYMFQEPRLLPWLTVEENLAFALSHVIPEEAYRHKRDGILRLLEIDDKVQRYPHQLSGGEQQRVALARAFLMPSELLLMDEAFKGLDPVTKQALMAAFIALWTNDPKTVIAVSHDIQEAVALSDCIVLFSKSPVQIVTKLCLEPSLRRSADPAAQQTIAESLKHQMMNVLTLE